MDKYLFMKTVLARLADGAAFRGDLARVLKAGAAAGAIAGLLHLVEAWNFTGRQEAAGIIGGIAYMFLFAAGVYMAVHATVLRAEALAALPKGGFAALPAASLLLLLAGEAAAALCVAVAAAGGILIWLAGDASYGLLRTVSFLVPFRNGGTFVAGLLFILRGAARGVLALVAGTLASELLLVAEIVAAPGRAGADVPTPEGRRSLP